MGGKSRCEVRQCPNRNRNQNTTLDSGESTCTFRFPDDKSRCNEWYRRLGIDDIPFNQRKMSWRVCQLHFDDIMFTSDKKRSLKKDALPHCSPEEWALKKVSNPVCEIDEVASRPISTELSKQKPEVKVLSSSPKKKLIEQKKKISIEKTKVNNVQCYKTEFKKLQAEMLILKRTTSSQVRSITTKFNRAEIKIKRLEDRLKSLELFLTPEKINRVFKRDKTIAKAVKEILLPRLVQRLHSSSTRWKSVPLEETPTYQSSPHDPANSTLSINNDEPV